ncbi:MAG: biotin--[acetyl-CoA-carboxylase] ligase [Bacillota bacterium]|nr:biotin--[acetyl-CoA-carboxylase] ligase [Bacillota bacterium]
MFEARVLEKLKKNENNFISGEKLSEDLGVSRTSVWKYINALKDAGYNIESVSKKGYRLIYSQDLLNEFEIGYNLKTNILGKHIHYMETVDSTNIYARNMAIDGALEGTVVIADAQITGRGRLGRSWSSAAKKGIWMSVVLRPGISPEEVQIITIGASVAVVKAIFTVTGIRAGIKWPNDIILEGKKLCGILTEMNSEIERVNFLILGIGINVNHNPEDFPEDIRSIATSLKIFSENNFNNNVKLFTRSDIIKELLFELENLYIKINKGDLKEIIDEWKEYSVTLGKHVKVLYRSAEYSGIAEDIKEDGRLIVNCEDGIVREIFSGEVSVRGVLGYS